MILQSRQPSLKIIYRVYFVCMRLSVIMYTNAIAAQHFILVFLQGSIPLNVHDTFCSCKSQCTLARTPGGNRGCPCKGQSKTCNDKCKCGSRSKPCKNTNQVILTYLLQPSRTVCFCKNKFISKSCKKMPRKNYS